MFIKLDIISSIIFLTKILCCIFLLKYCIYFFKRFIVFVGWYFYLFYMSTWCQRNNWDDWIPKSRDLIWNLRNTSHATTTIFIPFLNQIKIKIEDSKSLSYPKIVESIEEEAVKTTTASMEAILVDSVQNSLRHFLHSNAIFLSHRLCAQFPSEVLKIQFFIAFLDHTLIWKNY